MASPYVLIATALFTGETSGGRCTVFVLRVGNVSILGQRGLNARCAFWIEANRFHFSEGLPRRFKNSLDPSKIHPPSNCDVHILWGKLTCVDATPGHLAGYDRRPRTAERLVNGLTGAAVVLDRALHAFDRLLRAMAGFRFGRLGDLPKSGLFSITTIVTGLTLSDSVPTWFMVRMIITTTYDKLALSPNDLGTNAKVTSYQTFCNNMRHIASMPNVGNVTRNSAQASRQSALSSFRTLPVARPAPSFQRVGSFLFGMA